MDRIARDAVWSGDRASVSETVNPLANTETGDDLRGCAILKLLQHTDRDTGLAIEDHYSIVIVETVGPK